MDPVKGDFSSNFPIFSILSAIFSGILLATNLHFFINVATIKIYCNRKKLYNDLYEKVPRSPAFSDTLNNFYGNLFLTLFLLYITAVLFLRIIWVWDIEIPELFSIIIRISSVPFVDSSKDLFLCFGVLIPISALMILVTYFSSKEFFLRLKLFSYFIYYQQNDEYQKLLEEKSARYIVKHQNWLETEYRPFINTNWTKVQDEYLKKRREAVHALLKILEGLVESKKSAQIYGEFKPVQSQLIKTDIFLSVENIWKEWKENLQPKFSYQNPFPPSFQYVKIIGGYFFFPLKLRKLISKIEIGTRVINSNDEEIGIICSEIEKLPTTKKKEVYLYFLNSFDENKDIIKTLVQTGLLNKTEQDEIDISVKDSEIIINFDNKKYSLTESVKNITKLRNQIKNEYSNLFCDDGYLTKAIEELEKYRSSLRIQKREKKGDIEFIYPKLAG